MTTGAEILAQVRRDYYDPALLDGCVLLTAEEAQTIREHLGEYEADCVFCRERVVPLLTPEQP